ncbi:unnamed protein product [Medioppia subpectinata]|uniref:RNA (guanine-9-)-methyltransferase domain-containing protein 1 n=1 Tax=Medioppia subpectinata TaxID=1979941 RepID=A0A7R9KKR1_9ACAR|nr:unnamed protein product [Medioppia subpectinata]CAG2105037.1 unnamed protein product [Medioppia subpectinata]
MPSHITVHHMRQLLQCNHMVRRGRMWSDLSGHRRRDLLGLLKKVEDNDGRNQLTAPFVPYEFERLFANRLKTAAMFGQNMVFDISFDSHMSTSECKNLAEQLNRIYQWNRYHVREDTRHMPFNIHLCNVIAGHKTIHFVDFLFPHLTSSESFVNITSKCYTDVFDRRDLIYLSPHATEVMTEYESNAVFIIGGIVDRNKLLDLSYPKARQQNIRSMRLPIDSVVNKSNVQSLDSVFKVLVDFKNAGFVDNFEAKSLATRIRKHLPNHKLKSVQQITDESSTKREMDNILNDLYDSDQQFDDNIANKS